LRGKSCAIFCSEQLTNSRKNYHEVLMMRDVREMNIAETAQCLGVSEGVVKTRLFRARPMMQKIVAPRLQAQGRKKKYGRD